MREAIIAKATCGMCDRSRTLGDPEHPMDAYDYTPMQAVTAQLAVLAILNPPEETS